VKNAIPVTTVARTLIDLIDVLRPDRVLRAIRETEYRVTGDGEDVLAELAATLSGRM
jgi:hypothetical protein